MTDQVIDPFDGQAINEEADDVIDDDSLPADDPLYDIPTRDVPHPDDVVTDDSLPAEDPLFEIPSKSAPHPTHTQRTRKMLALVLLILLGIIYIGIYAFFLPGNLSAQNMNTAIAGLSGLQGLAGAAVGFYYGTKDKNKP